MKAVGKRWYRRIGFTVDESDRDHGMMYIYRSRAEMRQYMGTGMFRAVKHPSLSWAMRELGRARDTVLHANQRASLLHDAVSAHPDYKPARIRRLTRSR